MNRTIRPLATRVGQLGLLGQPATTVMSSRSRVIGGMSNIMRTSTTTRHYTSAPQQGGSGHNPLLWIGCISLGAAYTYYQKKQGEKSNALVAEAEAEAEEAQNKPKEKTETSQPKTDTKPEANKKVTEKSKHIDYQKIYNDIADLLDSNPDYDDGSYGPVLLRLAWHSSGTFAKEDNSGGSNGGTMRFRAEASHAANNGLEIARDLLEQKIKSKYPDISYGDLYTLGGVVAVQELGGPDIKWRPGRKDEGENKCTPDGRLPDGSKLADHVRDIFYRMGFDDCEIVVLTGAHVLGRCHPDRSGYDGPWQEAPTMFSNDYYKVITSREWVKKDLPHGLWQWVDKANPDVMMLPIEIAMLEDKNLRLYYNLYAKDIDKFYEDFAKAFKKLIELGVPFTGEEKEYVFKRVNN